MVLRWADELAEDFRSLFGYTLHTTARHARLIRRLDVFDGSQAIVAANSGRRPFDRRRLAYLCLVLACLHGSRVEIALSVEQGCRRDFADRMDKNQRGLQQLTVFVDVE